MFEQYDIIVVGGGHAGCEAAHAAGSMGAHVLMVTMNMNNIAQMSCNPAIGGVAKGQIVREIDALGGMTGVVADETSVQFRMLNRSKGPAMWSPRCQSDRMRFAEHWRLKLEQNPNVSFWQEMVTQLIIEDGKVTGVITQMGIRLMAKAVILTNGTFMNGLIHVGEKHFGGGRVGERSSHGITAQLDAHGFVSGRMKTGTPPRVDGRTLDYSRMEEQHGEKTVRRFSFRKITKPEHERSCWITYTSPDVHDELRKGFEKSPMFNGRIKSVGPRYCPSIEDKVNRFASRDRHQIFVEPEGWHTVEVYVNGFSTSLPEEVQFRALRKIAGFEQAKMFRPGYAIEYDFFPPTQLKKSLETKPLACLFFAGQINGTTGYEEAACQGLLSGINACRLIRREPPVILNRDQAYIGVLIDDLINKGTDEPYRMFTSRAEFRVSLRQDNADMRLSELGHQLGLLEEDQYSRFIQKRDAIKALWNHFQHTSVPPDEVNPMLESIDSAPVKQKRKAIDFLSRPRINLNMLLEACPTLLAHLPEANKEARDAFEVQVKYAGFIEKEKEMVDKMNRLQAVQLYSEINYRNIRGLSAEAAEKLSQHKPETLGDAARISGVTPSDVSVLLVHMGR